MHPVGCRLHEAERLLVRGVVGCCRSSQVDERRRCVMVDGPSSFFYCGPLGN